MSRARRTSHKGLATIVSLALTLGSGTAAAVAVTTASPNTPVAQRSKTDDVTSSTATRAPERGEREGGERGDD